MASHFDCGNQEKRILYGMRFQTRFLATFVIFAFFIFLFFLYTRNNNFPFFYHTDEPSKAEQLLSGERNFFHPALMLNVTDGVARLVGTPRDKQNMVEAGRNVSAFFAVLSVLGLALVAHHLAGIPAGILTALFCSSFPDFYDSAHYMKEDPFWISGMAFCFLAALAYWKKPGKYPVLLLGMAAGWSVAGKYIGAISLGVALLTVIAKMIATRTQQIRLLLICLTGTIFVFAAVNYQMISRPSQMAAGFGKEVVTLYNTDGRREDVFKPDRYLNILQDTVPPIAILLAGGLLLQSVWDWQKKIFPEFLFFSLPLILGIALTFTPKGSIRYFLPIGLMVLTSAAVALSRLMRAVPPKPVLKIACLLVSLSLIAAILVPLTKEFHVRQASFVADDRKQLADYIRKNIPVKAQIVADQRADIACSNNPRYAGFPNVLPHQISRAKYAADLGTLDALIARGVSYVIISSREVKRLEYPEKFPPDERETLGTRKKFYQELYQRGTVEWESTSTGNKYLNVPLVLFRVSSVN